MEAEHSNGADDSGYAGLLEKGSYYMIPKIIHFCWLSGDPYPELVAHCIDTWHKILPDYEIMLWDTNRFDVNSVEWVKQSYEHRKYELAADYIRFYALYNYGGIYLDSDVEVLKSFDDLLSNKFFWGYEYTGIPEAAVLGSEKGVEWIKNCMSWFEQHVPYDENGKFHRMVCPRILQYGFVEMYSKKLIDSEKIEKIDGGVILPYFYLSPKNNFSGEVMQSEKTICIHQFNSFWLKNNLSVKIRRNIHIGLIRVIGKKNYNRIMYRIRLVLHGA